jgi:hypothetical protein
VALVFFPLRALSSSPITGLSSKERLSMNLVSFVMTAIFTNAILSAVSFRNKLNV